MSGSLKLITWNTCGIRDTSDGQQKKKHICQWLNEQQASVAFLQETHIGVNNVSHVDIRGWKAFYTVHHPRSKGVAILIKNDLHFDYIYHDEEPTGSYIVLICKLKGKYFTLVNVYNHAKEHKVLSALSEYLRQTAKGVLIVAGDFNTVLNTDLDRQYPTGHTEPLRPFLEEFISSLMLVDIWTLKNPHERESYTRFPWKPSKQQTLSTSVQKKKKKMRGASRLDMVFMSRSDERLAESCQIHRSVNVSDHFPVVLNLRLPQTDSQTDQTATSAGLENVFSKKTPFRKKPGDFCEAEVLRALMSLVEYETPLGENVESFKSNKEQKTHDLKELFNQMIRRGIPDRFTESVNGNGRQCFRVEYMILARILVWRIEKFLQPSFKTKPIKLSYQLFAVVEFSRIPHKIKRDFLKHALRSLKPIHPSPPRNFKIVENLLPSSVDGEYMLRRDCPLTPTLLTVALKRLASILKQKLQQSVVDVCHHRKCITIYMNNDRYLRLKENIYKFQLQSGFSLSPKVARFWKRGAHSNPTPSQ